RASWRTRSRPPPARRARSPPDDSAGPVYNTAAVDPHVLPLLRCPRCHAVGSFTGARALACHKCKLAIDAERGFYDLLDVAPRGEPAASTTEQRLMESELVARMYERIWRPAFVRLFAGKGAGAAVGGFAGEMFIHKHALALDDKHGPWLDLSCGPG